MDENYITRGALFHLLSKWQSGELSTQDVWDWASHHYLPELTEYDDREDGSSVASEILCRLDSLDMHLMLAEDAPLYFAFLATPVGEFQEGYKQWQLALERIDSDARRLQLKDDPIYAEFCNPAGV